MIKAKEFIELANANNGYKPTVHMIAYALAKIENPEKSDNSIADIIGCTSQNIYAWKGNPNFNKWHRDFFDKVAGDRFLPELYANLFARAKSTDTPAAKILIERFDKNYKPQISQSIQIDNFKPREQAEENIKARIKALQIDKKEEIAEFEDKTTELNAPDCATIDDNQ